MAESVISNNQTLMIIEKENKESTTLIWFDPNIGIKEDTERTKQQLRRINDYVIFHTDLEQCITYIQSIYNEKIFLITSGSKASQLLPHVCCLRQVDSIFIFCLRKDKYEYLVDDYSKIIRIYVDLDDLCQSIQEQVDLVDKQLQTFSFYDKHQQSTKDLSKQAAEFLWFQLFNYVVTHLPRNQQAKQQMIQMCRQTEDIDQLYTFRFYIGDLSKSLQHEHEKILSSEEKILTVYRGTKLDKDEFDRLKENQGKLISTNGYLSTSRAPSKALAFAMKQSKRTDVISVLFQIECDIQQLGKSVIFADIVRFSEHRTEKEILFDLNACFRIQSIEEQESFYLIKMSVSNEGQTITKDYLELIQKEVEEKSVSIIFGRLMCSFGQYDKSQKYFEQLLNESNGEDLAWIEHNIGRALYYKGEWKEAREYYDHAYNRMITSEPARITDSTYILNNIGLILDKQGKYDDALDFHRRALEIRKNHYPSVHIDIARSLNNIGNILAKQRKYQEALSCYEQALEIKKKSYPPGHVSIAASLNNIGIILKQQEKYHEALNCCQQALTMQENYYPSGHADLAQTYNNIGLILFDQENYSEALDYFQEALKMRENHYAFDHIDIAQSFYNIGRIFFHQEKYNEALDYYQRAMKIQEKYYSSGHADTAETLYQIGIIMKEQKKYEEALDYYQQALEMQEKYYTSGHASIARTLNNIGIIFSLKERYEEALDYYKRAREIQERYYQGNNIDICISLNNIATCYEDQNMPNRALGYYQQALLICEKLLPVEHPQRELTVCNIRRLTENK